MSLISSIKLIIKHCFKYILFFNYLFLIEVNDKCKSLNLFIIIIVSVFIETFYRVKQLFLTVFNSFFIFEINYNFTEFNDHDFARAGPSLLNYSELYLVRQFSKNKYRKIPFC